MAGDCAYNKPYANEDTFCNKHLLEKQELGGNALISDSAEGETVSSPFFEVIDGVLYRKKLEKGYINYREVLDTDRRRNAIATFHQKRLGKTHHTLEDTYRFVAENYWWEGMFCHIREYVLGCEECREKHDGGHVHQQPVSKTLSSYGNDLLCKLNGQRGEGLFCDITLKVGGRSFSAHKAVLAAVSEYFQEIFTEMDSTASPQTAIDLTGYSEESFLPLLEFSYSSTLSLKLENLIEVSAMARHFRMWPVVEVCKAIEREQGHMGTKNNSGLHCQRESISGSPPPASTDASVFICKIEDPQDGVAPSAGKEAPCRKQGKKAKAEDCLKTTLGWLGESSRRGPEESLAPHFENGLGLGLGPCEDLRAEAVCRPSWCATPGPTVQEESFQSSSKKRLKLMDFKSPSNKRKSPRSLTASAPMPSPAPRHPSMTLRSMPLQRVEGPLKETVEAGSVLPSVKYKQKLRYSHPAECSQEPVSSSSLAFSSPIKEEPIEEEVQSPTTLEKYKLLSVLGLQRKSLVVCGEEPTGWRQKKRLRKLKVSSYSLTTRRKPRTVQPNSEARPGEERRGASKPTSLGEAGTLPAFNCTKAEGRRSLSIKKAIKTEPTAVSIEELGLKRGGCGLTPDRNTRSRAAAVQSTLQAEQRAAHGLRETRAARCRSDSTPALHTQPLSRLRSGNAHLQGGLKYPAGSRQGTVTSTQKRPLNLAPSHMESFLSLKVKKSISRGCSLEVLPGSVTGSSGRVLRSNRQSGTGTFPSSACTGQNLSLKAEVQELDNCPLQKDCGRAGRETKPWNLGAKSQSLQTVVCKTEPFFDLGKRKSKPTQKLLDAGFLFSLYRPGNAILMSSSAIKRESTTPEVAPTKPVSRKSTKEEGCSRSGFSEIAGRTRRAVREARALPGFDGRLREAKGTRPQAKRSASSEAGLAQTSVRRAGLENGGPARALAERGARPAVAKEVPKNLRRLLWLRSGQSKLLESLRRKRLRRLRAARRVPGNIAPVVSHTCPECSAFYKNCDTLIMHRIRHIEGKHWPCPLCNKSFFRQRNVQNHIRTHDQKLYKCRLCIT
nr:PREDICTED: uncharacterized protein LOC107079467 [Lepisosteus oculatus]